MKLADIKLENSEACLIKYGKKLLSSGFKNMDIICRKQDFKICLYLKRFYSDFKFSHFSFFNTKIK